MRKTELIVSGEVICPKTKASIVAHEHTNVETLLDQQNRTSSTITQSSAMSQVGVGDDMDLSFCVEDGFYESATLYGKSMVNCIQEPSSKDVVLPYAFENGQYVTINDTKESGALGVELKGQTLVNVVDYDDLNLKNATRNGDYFTLKHGVDVNQSWVIPKKNDKYLYKPNTMYTIIVNITENTTGQRLGISNIYTCTSYVNGKNRFDNLLGESKLLVRTGSDVNVPANQSEVRQLTYFGIWDGSGDLTTHIKFNFMILEGDWTDKETPPYFEGMTSCKMPILHTVGKNLFDGNLENGSLDIDTGKPSADNSYNRTVNFIRIYPNKEYRLRANGTVNGRVFYYDENKVYISTQLNENRLTNIPSNAKYLKFRIGVDVLSNGQEIQLEESSAPTTYEPHRSSILSLPEEVVLRSLPNGVRDTFNTRTGVYTQRIGEVVLNGTESWKAWESNDTHCKASLAYYPADMRINGEHTTRLICDKLKIISDRVGVINDNFMASVGDAVYSIVVGLELSKLASADIAGLKQWLSQNPITVQYQLENPIVTKINLPSTLKSWNTTTHIYSEIPENTLYPTLSHSNPTYPVILKPSTKYSIVANSYSNDHTNSAINFNLGGATASTTVGNRVTTITTPSTLSNELLTMSGRGNKLNNVMVIEGEVVGDEPYFEGICDCKSPTLSNVGKNLISSFTESSSIQATTGNVVETDEWIVNDEFVKIKKNIPYTISLTGNMGMTNGGWVYVYPYDFNKKFLGRDERKDLGRTNKTFMFDYDCFVKFTCKVKNVTSLQLEERSSATSYEPYKFNLSSTSNNIFDGEWENGAYDSSGRENDYNASRNKNKYIKVEPSCTIITTYPCVIHEYDVNKQFIQYTYNVQKLTLSDRTQYINFRTLNGKTCNSVEYQNFSMQVVDKTIVLRSLPNGVCDTLNVETGEYVQNIMEFTVGKEDSKWYAITEYDKTLSAQIDVPSELRNMFYKNASPIVCDKFPWLSASQDAEHVRFSTPADVAYSNTIIVWINKTKLSSYTANGINDYIKSVGGITVQGRLLSPIVKTVDLEGYPFAYKDGHIVLSSGSIEASLTPKIEYVVQTNRAGAIQANQDRLINHDKRLAVLEDLVLHQLIQLEYNRAKCTFLSQTRQIAERGIQMYHTKYELLSEFIEKKLYRSLEEVFEMLDVYFMLGDITDGEYDALYEALMPSAEEIFEVEETFDHEGVEV